MGKYLIILLFSTYVLAEDFIKIKAKKIDDHIQVKIKIESNSFGPEDIKINESYSTYKTTPLEYIKHLVVKVDNEIAFDVLTSPYLSKNPIFGFSFKESSNNKMLNISVTDNDNNVKTINTTLANAFNMSKIALQNKDKKEANCDEPKILEAKTINEAINALHNDSKHIIDDKIKIYASGSESKPNNIMEPHINIGASRIRLHIQSTLNFESLVVLSEGNPKVVIALFNNHKSVPTDYFITFKLTSGMYNWENHGYAINQKIVVIAKDKMGKLYRGIYFIDIYRSGESCG